MKRTAQHDLVIDCPPMLVSATGWWPSSDRIAETLFCTGSVFGVPFVTWEQDPSKAFRFPETRIKMVSRGVWQAAPVIAWGYTVNGDYVQLDYGPEPIIRRGLRKMEAQPIPNDISKSYIETGGRRRYFNAWLPTVLADAGAFFGIRSFTVRATQITGSEVLGS